jgi:hypothetical protein
MTLMMRVLILTSCLLFVLFLYAQFTTARAETRYGETLISMTS